ncbi:hypothetical protein EDB85DRAFT_862539 [Lactarius pseudohatsudake]|nr:hypothetical protein EDB85DRAFT_862539 [Lactarius pseudohatsudake]
MCFDGVAEWIASWASALNFLNEVCAQSPVRNYCIPATSTIVNVTSPSYSRMYERSRKADSAVYRLGYGVNGSRQYNIGGTISESVGETRIVRS